MTDFHSHILPGIDDGARDPATSLAMLSLLRAQGIGTVYATPHFYADTITPEDFLAGRERAFRELLAAAGDQPLPEIRLGAEILLAKRLSVLDLTGLTMGDLPYMLFEFGGADFRPWFVTEIDKTASKHAAFPIIAHIDRFPWLGVRELAELMRLDRVVFQVNCEGLSDIHTQRKLAFLLDRGQKIILGSDCHNTTSRAPDFDLARAFFEGPAPVERKLFSHRVLFEPAALKEAVLFSSGHLTGAPGGGNESGLLF